MTSEIASAGFSVTIQKTLFGQLLGLPDLLILLPWEDVQKAFEFVPKFNIVSPLTTVQMEDLAVIFGLFTMPPPPYTLPYTHIPTHAQFDQIAHSDFQRVYPLPWTLPLMGTTSGKVGSAIITNEQLCFIVARIVLTIHQHYLIFSPYKVLALFLCYTECISMPNANIIKAWSRARFRLASAGFHVSGNISGNISVMSCTHHLLHLIKLLELPMLIQRMQCMEQWL